MEWRRELVKGDILKKIYPKTNLQSALDNTLRSTAVITAFFLYNCLRVKSGTEAHVALIGDVLLNSVSLGRYTRNIKSIVQHNLHHHLFICQRVRRKHRQKERVFSVLTQSW